MAFTRWGFVPPRESLRVVALAQNALRQIGQTDPARNIAVVRGDAQQLRGWGAQDTILISRVPFTSADIQRLQNSVARAKLQMIYLPGSTVDNPFRALLDLTRRPPIFRFLPFRRAAGK